MTGLTLLVLMWQTGGHMAEDVVMFVGSHGDLLGAVAVRNPF